MVGYRRFYHPLHSQIQTFTCRSVNAGVITLKGILGRKYHFDCRFQHQHSKMCPEFIVFRRNSNLCLDMQRLITTPMKTKLSPQELSDLHKIQSTPTDRYRSAMRFFRWFSVFSCAILVIGMVWLYNYRSPTVLQAMYFAGFIALCNCIGVNLLGYLDCKYVRMIHHLTEKLESENQRQTHA